jgi:hypothetical protein
LREAKDLKSFLTDQTPARNRTANEAKQRGRKETVQGDLDASGGRPQGVRFAQEKGVQVEQGEVEARIVDGRFDHQADKGRSTPVRTKEEIRLEKKTSKCLFSIVSQITQREFEAG